MIINNIDEVVKALETDKITPTQAKAITIKALGLLDTSMPDAPEPSKEETLKNIIGIKESLDNNCCPILYNDSFLDYD